MGDRLKNWVALDKGSAISLLSNPNSVQDIQTSDKTLALVANARVTRSNEEAAAPGFGNVCFDKDAIANIFGPLDHL